MGRIGLIADDDEYFRIAITKILRDKLKFSRVIETGSFDEAVERLEHDQPVDLAVFDLNMPGMDTPAVLRTIRESFAVEKMAVVSGSRSREDILQSLEAGAHGFVSKSQGAQDLHSALQQIMDGRIYVPPVLAEIGQMHEDARHFVPSPVGGQFPRVTPRQMDVLRMLVEGKSNKEIALSLNLGPGTVKVHLAALFRNLGVSNRSAAAVAGADLLRRMHR